MCAPTRTGCRVVDAAGCGTHTHTHAQLAGIPPSTPQHEEGVRRQTWRVCVVVWATGRHARRGGHGQLLSCSAWIPPVPSQEKRENEGGRGRERVSKCDLCWHCMSVLKQKEKEGEGDTHLACSCCCPLIACQPLRCAGVPRTHTLLLLLTATVRHHAHTPCACMFVSVANVHSTHTRGEKEGGRGECGLFGLLCFVFV